MQAPASRTLLILDLDETLIFGTKTPLDRPPDLMAGAFAVYLRPGAVSFVDQVLDHFEVAVWTAASRSYATPIVAALFGAHLDELRVFWTAERCTVRRDPETMEWYPRKSLKKLRRLGYRQGRMLIVDNPPATYDANYGNAVPVQDFEGDLADDELSHLGRYLLTLKDRDDVRPIEKRWWRDS